MNTLRIGIIGTGAIARDHAAAIQQLARSAELVAAADLVSERLEAFAGAFGVARRYTDAGELLADSGVDLVTIATPPGSHEALAIGALERGKYVLCEKPLAASLGSARRIAAAAARHPGRLAVGYQFRYANDHARLIWLCQNGWLGDITSARVERHSYIPQAGEWWGSWPVAGGGVLMTQMIHELDLLQLVMGPPAAVDAALDTRYTSIESEDYVDATIRFASGATARCIGSANSGRLAGGLTVHGTRGSVSLPWSLSIADPAHRAAATEALAAAFAAQGTNGPASLSAHARLYKTIGHQINGSAALPISAADSLVSLEMCAAAYESSLIGREVQLPLGADSVVFNGVSKAAYDARARKAERKFFGVPGITEDGQLPPIPTHAEGGSLKQRARAIAVRTVRRALDTANLQPETIKALIRKPAPVHGGARVRRLPWPRRRHFDAREKRAAMQVLDREMRRGQAVIYGGPEEQAYCEAFTAFLGAGGYADAVNSGTNAVYVALRALDLEPGSEVIVAPISDPGGIMPVVMNMCVPVSADSDYGSMMTSADQMRRVLTDRTSAILVTHIGGHPVDLDPILALAAERGIPVVEDCAQSHGARYKGRMVGTLGAIAAFSTMFGKHHATGAQGGVVFTQDLTLFSRAKQVADRGKSYDQAGHQANMIASLNFNQDEISMAIGRVQLAKLPSFIKARRAFASQVEIGIRGVEGVSIVGDPPWGQSSYLYLMLRLEPATLRCDSEAFASALASEGIDGASPGYSVYPTDQPWCRERVVFPGTTLPWSLAPQDNRTFELRNAHAANGSTVRLEIHEALGPREVRDLVAAISKLARYFRR